MGFGADRSAGTSLEVLATKETEAGGLLKPGNGELLETSLGSIVRPCLKFRLSPMCVCVPLVGA